MKKEETDRLHLEKSIEGRNAQRGQSKARATAPTEGTRAACSKVKTPGSKQMSAEGKGNYQWLSESRLQKPAFHQPHPWVGTCTLLCSTSV